jgi:kumamolisin
MSKETRIPISGSVCKHPSGARCVSPVAKDEQLRITLVLRRKTELPPVATQPQGGQYRSREEYAQRYGAAPQDLEAIKAFARNYGLTVTDNHLPSRRAMLSGPAEAMEHAFDVTLGIYETPDGTTRYRDCSGPLSLPADLQRIVVAVLGLDTRAAAKPHFRVAPQQNPAAAFTPPQLAKRYRFPTGLTGHGQSIALIELGGGYRQADLDTYFASLNLATPSVAAVSVDGGENQPGSNADGEVMLDIEVAGAIAPQAKLFVYFAPNTDQGFHDALATAIHDTERTPAIISISWGGPEDAWAEQSRNALNAALEDAVALGVTVAAAAGDGGSSDGVDDGAAHVDFPASSPYTLSCGGTKLPTNGATGASEQVWNELANNEGATGGGVSRVFALPDYQAGIGVPPQPDTQFVGRGVPDVAGDADPVTGYRVRVDGQDIVIGGTSAVAPLWAGLIALFNQQLARSLGFINPAIYQLGESVFNDIVEGNNGIYSANHGWDACTGLGSPNGTALLNALFTSPASARQPR